MSRPFIDREEITNLKGTLKLHHKMKLAAAFVAVGLLSFTAGRWRKDATPSIRRRAR